MQTCSPSPNLLIAAVAQRTKRLRLGTLGSVLCLHQPFRLAEELAMLDYLTDGRLEIGTAPGIPPVLGYMDITPAEVHDRYDEAIQILEMARKEREISFQGKYYQYKDLPSLPRPLKVERRRTWRAASSEAAVIATAKRNAKLGLGFQSIAEMKSHFATYHQTMAAEGYSSGPDDIAIRRQILIWDTDSEAAALQAEALRTARASEAKAFSVLASALAARRGPPPGAEGAPGATAAAGPPSGAPKKDFNLADLIHEPDEYIHGSPRTVADWIIDQCRQTGAGNVMGYLPEAFTESQILHQLKLWPQVMQILKSADVLLETA